MKRHGEDLDLEPNDSNGQPVIAFQRLKSLTAKARPPLAQGFTRALLKVGFVSLVQRHHPFPDILTASGTSQDRLGLSAKFHRKTSGREPAYSSPYRTNRLTFNSSSDYMLPRIKRGNHAGKNALRLERIQPDTGNNVIYRIVDGGFFDRYLRKIPDNGYWLAGKSTESACELL